MHRSRYVCLLASLTLSLDPFCFAASEKIMLNGPMAFTDYRQEKAGVWRKFTVADLPKPGESSGGVSLPRIVPKPAGAMPQSLPGFRVSLYAENLENPRQLRTAPNGDLFVAESGPGRIKVIRGSAGKAQTVSIFAEGLNQPFGIAFYPPGPEPKFLYIGNTDSVVRFPYSNGDLKARGARQIIVPELPARGGHWTRDVIFSRDGRKMFVAVGSRSNVDDPDTTPAEHLRANILEFNPDGSGRRVYAYGIRNPVSIVVHPQTGELWTSVNERDRLGDNLVPDYITSVKEGGFYGWPWFYLGPNQDPRHAGKRPDLKDKVIVPDILLQAHLASLGMLFYSGQMFPSEFQGHIFAAEHGSWNRSVRAGYKVIRAPVKDGRATGEYQDFLTGFVTADGEVWGRPVGVAVAPDGALIVSDDGSESLWRVAYGSK